MTLRLDDEAAAPLPVCRPRFKAARIGRRNILGSAIAFNAPAPPVTSANAALSVFDGTNPNGTWRLFVQDELRANRDRRHRGWLGAGDHDEGQAKKKR